MEEKLKSINVIGNEDLKKCLTCQICKSIVLSPVTCINCENLFCQECTETMNKKECEEGGKCEFS